MGLVGIAGRVWWSGAAGKADDPAAVLPLLGLGAVASVAVVTLADQAHWLVWFGAAGIGVFAVAGRTPRPPSRSCSAEITVLR